METEVQTQRIDDEHAFSKMTEGEIAKWISGALRRPDSFMYLGDNDEMFVTWSYGWTIRTRDSGIREKANAATVVKILKTDPSLADDWHLVESSHWAVGWVEQVSFRVTDEDGSPSRVARILKGMMDTLTEQPALDDSEVSRMEYEDTLENIRGASSSNLRDDVPIDWDEKMYEWFGDNDQDAVDPYDGGGGYPSDAQFEKAARALGYWDTSEDDEVQRAD